MLIHIQKQNKKHQWSISIRFFFQNDDYLLCVTVHDLQQYIKTNNHLDLTILINSEYGHTKPAFIWLKWQ